MTTRRKILHLLATVAVIFFGIATIYRSRYSYHPLIQGNTMGTTYNIRITGKLHRTDVPRLKQKIKTCLQEINNQMSTWDPNSEISQFNTWNTTDPFELSPPLFTVVQQALDISQQTGGAFDPTLGPLINLWGFGNSALVEENTPTPEQIDQAQQCTGWKKLTLKQPNILYKGALGLQLDLGAIAKGYGVDDVASLLEQEGLENFFVEIGGEVVVRGENHEGTPWRIGIQRPDLNPLSNRLQGIVHLKKGAIATSGDYRNYYIKDDIIYSHIIDPRSGTPKMSSTASVTVIAPDCLLADAAATALFVMGPEEGLSWVENNTKLDALFLIRKEDGSIIEKFSSGFVDKTGYSSPNF